MYRRVLAAVNEYSNSEMSARYAISFSKSCGTGLTLAFAAGENIKKEAIRRAEEAMERLFIEGKEAGVDMESIAEIGMPVDVIQKIVKEKGIDLVFVSARREDVHKRFFIKTVPRSLMLRLPCSVAMVRSVHMGRVHPKNILVPLRGDREKIIEKAFFVSRFALEFDSSVMLLHSPRPLKNPLRMDLHLKPDEWESRLPADMREFIDHLERYKVSHQKIIRPGSAGRNITLEAALRKNDLIIMGASRRGLISAVIRGNPVEEALRKTPCDIIIFKPLSNNIFSPARKK